MNRRPWPLLGTMACSFRSTVFRIGLIGSSKGSWNSDRPLKQVPSCNSPQIRIAPVFENLNFGVIVFEVQSEFETQLFCLNPNPYELYGTYDPRTKGRDRRYPSNKLYLSYEL
jgi:hypothetical protein